MQIAARTQGSGPTVLFLHGVGTVSGSFWAQFEGLGVARELIAWDAPGYGESSDPRIPVSLDDYADAAADLIEAHGRRDAHVVAVSWGGVIATRLALRHPARVRTLALVSSTYGRKLDEALHKRFEERVSLLERHGPRAFTEARVDGLVSSTGSPELKQRIIETAVGSVRLAGFAAATEILASTDHRDRLKAVRAPTLVLCGDQDHITGVPQSRVLAEGIPGAELLVVPGGGHLLNQEKPAEVNAGLRRLWAKAGGHDGGKS